MQDALVTMAAPVRRGYHNLFATIAMIILLAGSCVHRAAADVTTDDTSLATGACCLFQTMQCLEVAPQACANQGGVFLGVGTSCRDGGCTLGACCIADVPAAFARGVTFGVPGGCIVLHQAGCEKIGGVFLGKDTNCDDSPCLEIACCLPDGSCVTETTGECDDLGGEPVFAPGGDCSKVICDPIDELGGCCLCDGPLPVCLTLTAVDCAAMGGTFAGAGVFCGSVGSFVEYTSSPNAAIPDDDPVGITDTIHVPDNFVVGDILVALTINHSFVGDLCITLEHLGTTVELVRRPGTLQGVCHSGGPFGCNQDNYVNVVLDDLGSGGSIQDACVENLTSPPFYVPVGFLFDFVNMPAFGDWTLRVSDNAVLDLGTLVSWRLMLAPLSEINCSQIVSCGDPDPCTLPGRPDPNDPLSGERVLRGFVVGYAVDFAGNEIRWNHLSAGATSVDYLYGSAMEYPAATFTTTAAANGAVLPNPGTLSLDGVKYAAVPQMLLLSFAAEGSTAYSGNAASNTAFTELTLMPLDISFADGAAPAHTKAEFQIWNENEVKFSGTHRCVTCWDSTLLGLYGSPNHLLVNTLQTDRGKARIQGVASPLCPDSDAHALIGVQTRSLHDGLSGRSHTGSILTSVGLATATITAPITAPPPEAPQSMPAGIALGGSVASLGSRPDLRRRAEQDVPVQPMGGVLTPRMGTDKGSLFVIPRIEIRWDAQGNVIRDTFVHLTNDFPADVRVQMWFVNGDPDGFDIHGCPHKGWNFVDVLINLTQDQPIWWSALSGQPVGVSPFTVLDP